MNKPNCICKNCNKEFYEIPARIKIGRGQYCSSHCRNIGSAMVVQKECLQCKKQFAYKKRIYRTERKFCSLKCSTDYNIGKAPQIGEEGRKKLMVFLHSRKGKPAVDYDKSVYKTPEFKEKCRKHRLSQTFLQQDTDIEILLKEAMDRAGIKYEHPYNLDGKFICDFGFPFTKLIVEADGSYWHSLARNKHYDNLKNKYCETHGWRLVRFTDKQIKKEIDYCIDIIKTLNFKLEIK